MKILIIDTYKNVPYRISKDTSGGYGTGNDFGNSIFTNFLKSNLVGVGCQVDLNANIIFFLLGIYFIT